MTTVARFAGLLQRTMGLSPNSVGLPMIASALRTRLSAVTCKDLREYWEQVQGSDAELQELIEAVVVPETWFFRDQEAFVALARQAYEKWLRLCPDRQLRLLSLPCASGEEPYSMAMALVTAGLPANQFRIEGVDISVRLLARAQNAVYGRNSFRGQELAFRDRFFEPADSDFCLAKPVPAQVDFRHGNVLDPGFMADAPAYDFIFCRNLLIYFDAPTQDRTVEVLQRLLKPDGILFVGPSESGLFLNHDFVSARLPLAFAFRKRSDAAPEPDATVVRLRAPGRARATKAASAAATPMIKQATASRPPPTPPWGAAPGPALEAIARLANRGSLTEAIQHGEAFLRVHGPSAPVYQLMGLAHDASGMPQQAEQCYRKALYLDPTHHEALIHLAFLLEQQGDSAGALRLHMRAKRGNRRESS
jgi:chemotaxis protein methyltransferase WspC